MSSKGRNQFENFHPGRPQRELASVEKQKAELHESKSPGNFGAPHFPPGENLPPQAKRLALEKQEKAEKGARKRATRERPGAHREEDAARAHGAGEQLAAGQVPPEEYPDAAPKPHDARAAVRETLQRVEHQAQPVLKEARGHWVGAVDAAAEFVDETVKLLRIPAVLVRVLLDARKQA